MFVSSIDRIKRATKDLSISGYHTDSSVALDTGVKVNLAVTGISGDFYIGCNTKWGDDKYYGGRNFTYKPGSKRIVCGHSYGGARDGGYTYDGIKTDDLLMEENSEAIVVALEGKHAGSTRFETADARGEEDKSTPADAKKEE